MIRWIIQQAQTCFFSSPFIDTLKKIDILLIIMIYQTSLTRKTYFDQYVMWKEYANVKVKSDDIKTLMW